MGLGKERKKIRDRIPAWHCEGYFGYGHGRAVNEFGEKAIKDRSVCNEMCSRSQECRMAHHSKMDLRFPDVARVVHVAAESAAAMQRPIVTAIIAAMRIAEAREVPGTKDVRAILKSFRVADITDHYIAGQFENIQNGLDLKDPSWRRPLVEDVKQEDHVDKPTAGTQASGN